MAVRIELVLAANGERCGACPYLAQFAEWYCCELFGLVECKGRKRCPQCLAAERAAAERVKP